MNKDECTKIVMEKLKEKMQSDFNNPMGKAVIVIAKTIIDILDQEGLFK